MRLTTLGIFGAIFLMPCFSAAVEPQQRQNEFFNDLLISEEYAKIDESQQASQDARSKLKTEKKRIDVSDDRKLRDIIKKQQRDNYNLEKARKDIARISKLPPAPFGLLWGETFEEMLSSGIVLNRTEEKDYINSFIATQLPKPIKEMRYVVVTFGEENKLWRIIAYGTFIKDTPDASLILKEYRRYYDMLERKYGHAEQNYTPKITQVTKIVDAGNGKTREEIENIEEEIGNPNFLSQLQNGEADLFATFYNKEVGATLSVNVDGNGNSYILLEYKNLKIFQAKEDLTLDAL